MGGFPLHQGRLYLRQCLQVLVGVDRPEALDDVEGAVTHLRAPAEAEALAKPVS